MMKRRGLSLVLGAIALPLLASLPTLAQQQPTPPPAAPTAPQADTSRPRNQVSPADRAAFLDARIAAVHAGLRLSADQEKLWTPLESAVRDGMIKLADLRDKMRNAARPADALERMSRGAEASITRGEAMKRIADSARPLYATLSDEQKRRLPMLMHSGGGDRRGYRGGMGMGPGRDGGMMDGGMMRRGDRRDDGPRQGRRWSDRDDRRDRN
jgi:hypothetical protein